MYSKKEQRSMAEKEPSVGRFVIFKQALVSRNQSVKQVFTDTLTNAEKRCILPPLKAMKGKSKRFYWLREKAVGASLCRVNAEGRPRAAA